MTTFTPDPTARRPVCASYKNGLIRANDDSQYMYGRLAKRDGTQPGIIYCHAAGVSGNFWLDQTGVPGVSLWYDLADAGYILMSDQRDQSIARTVTDGVTNATTTVTSATANFKVDDIGRTISGTNIPANATITAWN